MATEGSADLPPDLKEQSIAYAAAHGIMVAASGTSDDSIMFHHAPFTLVPTPFPKPAFDKAVALAPLLDRLFDAIAHDTKWLLEVLERTVASDPFTRRLANILEVVEKEGVVQPVALQINRSDYMVHAPDGDVACVSPDVRQVEFNTMASSFGALSTHITNMHKAMAHRFSGRPDDRLVDNSALYNVADALVRAHEAYGVPDAVIVFVVQPGERNVMDQRMLEYEIGGRARVLRRSLKQLHDEGRLVDTDGRKRVLRLGDSDDAPQVAVAYFRAGYAPTDYPSEDEWAGRLTVERSAAIKCPNIAYHLAGTKKVQQVLAQPGVVARFLPGTDADTSAIMSSFAGLWALDAKDADPAVVEDAKAHPEKYVLKPQREGGGNNYFGPDVVEQLNTLSPTDLEGFILMERIYPPARPGVLLRNGCIISGECVNELGVFSTVLSDASGIRHSAVAGHLLRTKVIGTTEGGVASGYSCLSSPRFSADSVKK